MVEDELFGQIAMLLGGRAAEELWVKFRLEPATISEKLPI
jgi:ATP-dependent Zn protease